MKADLRNFALYEQHYIMDSQGSYFSGDGTAQGFKRTPGVTINGPVDLGHSVSLKQTENGKPARARETDNG